MNKTVKISLWCFLGFILLPFIYSAWYFFDGYISITPFDRAKILSGSMQIIHQDTENYRKTSNTFFSIPEWYIVFLSDDYTKWLEEGKNPSDFSYGVYLSDYWKMYGKIFALTRGILPPDSEYHTMVIVIGVSTTVEFGLKAFYEATFGRITSWLNYDSKQDRWYAQMSRKYVDFILLRPWYEFDFHTIFLGFHDLSIENIRGFERSFVYGFEGMMKAWYGKEIEKATHAQFALPDTTTLVEGTIPQQILKAYTGLTVHASGVLLTRYYPFTEQLPRLGAFERSGASVRIQKIAGNDHIVISTLQEKGDARHDREIFSVSQAISPEKERRFLFMPVQELQDFLKKHAQYLEHIYDF